jgi:hypothetical protein
VLARSGKERSDMVHACNLSILEARQEDCEFEVSLTLSQKPKEKKE